MFNLVSLVIGFIALGGAILGFFPFFGWLNWAVVPVALMGAAFKGFTSVARLLLERGADAETTNKAGQTALMLAALFDRREIADLLLAQGADPERCDAAGNSALSVARDQNNAAMGEHLRGTCPASRPGSRRVESAIPAS